MMFPCTAMLDDRKAGRRISGRLAAARGICTKLRSTIPPRPAGGNAAARHLPRSRPPAHGQGVFAYLPKGRSMMELGSVTLFVGRSRISLDTILGESNPAKGVSECEEETLVRMELSYADGRRRRRRKRSCAC